MCGIYGHLRREGTIQTDHALKALERIVHRGPDGWGTAMGSRTDETLVLQYGEQQREEESEVFLGHRRLQIVDLSDAAAQPMATKDGRFTLIFNGEIYNHAQLRQELMRQGHVFRTDHSDSEVLLLAFREWGEKCLRRLEGMFAFAIYDSQEKRLFLARDRVGQKPLFFAKTKKSIAFASEVTALVSLRRTWKLHDEALVGYLRYGYVPEPHTLFTGIQSLPAAHFAWFDMHSGAWDKEQYWDVSTISEQKSIDKWIDSTANLVSDAVQKRLGADVPVGAFVSGGIDSTVVLKYMHHAQKHIDVFGADFADERYSERTYIREAARTYQAKLTLVQVEEDPVARLDNILSIFDQPYDGGSAISLHELFAQIKGRKKVMLTGDGGDEVFAGYERYAAFARRMKRRKQARALGMHFFAPLMRCLGNRFARFASELIEDPIQHYLNLRFKPVLLPLLKEPPTALFQDTSRLEGRDNIRGVTALQYMEMRTILPGRMLYKVDRLSMYHGIEARNPLLDHRVIELAFSMPEDVRMRGGALKYVLKQLLADDFSFAFLDREKKGFGTPLAQWFRSGKYPALFQTLNNPEAKIYDVLDYEKVHGMYPEFQEGAPMKGHRYPWRLVVLAHYLERFRDTLQV